MNKKSACFTGPKENELPFWINSKEYKRVKSKLKEEIADLVWLGVSEFYVGGQTGIDAMCSQIVIEMREELYSTANLHLVIPYKGIEKEYNQRQKEEFDWIMEKADSVIYMGYKFRLFEGLLYNLFNILPRCFKDRNRYMVKSSDYLVAVWDGKKRGNVWDVVKRARRMKAGVKTFVGL